MPLNAAAMDSDGDLAPNEGGANRVRGRVFRCFDLVGERPAAAGAEAGAVDLLVVSNRGVKVEAFDIRGLSDGIVVRLYLGAFEVDTSSPKSARLRLPKDWRILGSTFSESDRSGDAWRLFKEEGAEDGARAERRQ